MSKPKTVELILMAIDELNLQLPSDLRVHATSETCLLGKGSVLDSLGLVTLILIVEELITDKHGVSIKLADEKAMSQSQSPFKSVQSLADYVDMLLRESSNGRH